MTVDSSLTARSDEAARYVDGVAAQLADLPDEDRADLLDELAAHVDELVAEGDTPLADRLGSPAEYAAELRASAGLPPARARGRAGAQALHWLRSLRRRSDVVAAAQFFGSLRPAWWVLRAWICVSLLTWFGQPHWWPSLVVVPDVGSGPIGAVVLVVAVVLSVQLGRRSRPQPSTTFWVALALNAVAVVGVLPVLFSLNEVTSYRAPGGYLNTRVDYMEVPPHEGVYAAGHQVWNIYAYDSNGVMLHDVRLFDQTGRPLSLGLATDRTRQVVVDAQGRLVENAFPYRYLEPDGTVAHPDAGPTVLAPPLAAAPSPSPSATPSPSASPTAGKR